MFVFDVHNLNSHIKVNSSKKAYLFIYEKLSSFFAFFFRVRFNTILNFGSSWNQKKYTTTTTTPNNRQKKQGEYIWKVSSGSQIRWRLWILFFFLSTIKNGRIKTKKKSHGGTNPHSTQYLFRYTYAWIICVFFRRGDITVFDQFFSEFVKENGKCTTTFTS